MSNFIRPPLLKGHYSPFSAIFFSLDQVEGYRRVFSLEETSYVFLFLPPTFSYRSPYRPFRSIRHPYVSCSLIHLGIFTSDCNIGTQSMNAFRYRILLSVSLSTHRQSFKNVALYFICFFTPVLLQPVVNFITVRSWWDLHNCGCENELLARWQDT